MHQGIPKFQRYLNVSEFQNPPQKKNSEGRALFPTWGRRHGLEGGVEGPALVRVWDGVGGGPQAHPGGALAQPSDHLSLKLETTFQVFADFFIFLTFISRVCIHVRLLLPLSIVSKVLCFISVTILNRENISLLTVHLRPGAWDKYLHEILFSEIPSLSQIQNNYISTWGPGLETSICTRYLRFLGTFTLNIYLKTKEKDKKGDKTIIYQLEPRGSRQVFAWDSFSFSELLLCLLWYYSKVHCSKYLLKN